MPGDFLLRGLQAPYRPLGLQVLAHDPFWGIKLGMGPGDDPRVLRVSQTVRGANWHFWTRAPPEGERVVRAVARLRCLQAVRMTRN
eukprot:1432719-Pyramimonas_sp.AAC.1